MKQNQPPSWEPFGLKPDNRKQTPNPYLVAAGRGVAIGVLTVLFAALLAMIVAIGVYAYYARGLPSADEMYERTTTFKSTKIYDREGQLLYEIMDPMGGRRTIVSYDDIPQSMIDAIVATEDETYFGHPGFSVLAIARAIYYDLSEGEIVSGASTITQQVAKNLFLSSEQTWSRKIKEAILAAEMTRRYSKTEILEVYLNEVYFGNLSYGLGAASETYFGKHVSQLELHESALLAGMVQSAALYDPYVYPESTLQRRRIVLRLMLENGFIDQATFYAAIAEPLDLAPRATTMQAPHFVVTVREELERRYGAKMLYHGGLQVHTTLDLNLQRLAEQAAREHVTTLQDQNATNAALVALDPHTGDILAMVGSVDFYDDAIAGQVNVATSLRQPGSTMKTLTYLAALERGWTPATLLMDVEQDFPDGANPPYHPLNYDLNEYGPVTMRTALACSRNIPAVSTLHQIGVPALLEVSQRLGIHSLTRDDYGLALTLGAGDVMLLEITAAYGALASEGKLVTPRSILDIRDQLGEVILPLASPDMPQVIDPRHAYLMSDMLSDNEARTRAFGANSMLKLSFPAAVKTGTTNDYRDSWTVGYTHDLVAGVWVGNSDSQPMDRVSGSRGAGPIWHDFMEAAAAGEEHTEFRRPEGLVEIEICPVSGQKHTERCPEARTELFLTEHVPEECQLHRKVEVCLVTNSLATEHCPREHVAELMVQDYGVTWDQWAIEQGYTPPPRQTCPLHVAPSNVAISAPSPVSGLIDIYGTTDVPGFAYYTVEYGPGVNPSHWIRLAPPIEVKVDNGVLCRWDTRGIGSGQYSVRVLVFDKSNYSYVAETIVNISSAASAPTTAATAVPPTITPTAMPPIMTPVSSPTSIQPTMTPLPTRVPPTPGAQRTRLPPPIPGSLGRATATATAESTATPEDTGTSIIDTE